MSLKLDIKGQLLRVDDLRVATETVVHKYDAFLNLLCAERFAFQRDAVRETWRFLVSEKYPPLELLARENWNVKPSVQQRHDSLAAYPGQDALARSQGRVARSRHSGWQELRPVWACRDRTSGGVGGRALVLMRGCSRSSLGWRAMRSCPPL